MQIDSAMVTNILSTLVMIGGMVAFFLSRLDKNFKEIDKKFERIDQRFEKVDDQFKEIRAHFDARCDKMEEQLMQINFKVSDLNTRVTVVETRLEERSPTISNYTARLPLKRRPGRPPRISSQ